MKTRLLLFCLLAFFSVMVYAVQPTPAPIPVYLTDSFILTDNQIYFIVVSLAVLGAGWITFS